MDINEYLLQPLISSTTTTTSAATAASTTTSSPKNHHSSLYSNSPIIIRLLSILFIGILSIWANFEASKGFDITIINDAKDSSAGRRFALLYVSNDKATRIILNATEFVENLLYPDRNKHPKKPVKRVTLRLGRLNLTRNVIVTSDNTHEFFMHIGPSIMEESNVNYAVESAVLRGMGRIWLWDSESGTPPRLIDGMVEYIVVKAGFGGESNSNEESSPGFDSNCWKNMGPIEVARLLSYWEGKEKGFIQRLNRALQYWNDQTVEEVIGMPAQHLCDSYNRDHNRLN